MAEGKQVGRPKRVFNREDVVRLRDEVGLSWAETADMLRIGIGTARRAYREQTALSGPAETIEGDG